MKIRNATSRPLTVAATGQTAGPGDVLEVDDDLGKHLCRQRDVWRESTARGSRSTSKKG